MPELLPPPAADAASDAIDRYESATALLATFAPSNTSGPCDQANELETAKARTFAFWAQSERYREFGQSTDTPSLDETPHRRRLAALLFGRLRVLDLACGDGNNLPHLPAGTDYVGLDCSPVALDRLAARDDHAAMTKRGLVGDCENLPLERGSVDAVISTFAFEHFTDVPRILDECDRVLAPGGRLILIGPDFAFPNNFGPPQHAELLNRRLPLLAYAAGRLLAGAWAKLRRRERFAYVEPLPLDDATYVPDADMTHLTDHAAIARHLTRRGYRRLVLAGSRPRPEGIRGWLHDVGLWGQNGDMLLAVEKPR